MNRTRLNTNKNGNKIEVLRVFLISFYVRQPGPVPALGSRASIHPVLRSFTKI